jgi:hypothetical protein
MSTTRNRKEGDWASRSKEDMRAEILELRQRDNERRKLEAAFEGSRRDRFRLEAEVTRLRERLIEEGLEPPPESWKPPRIARLEFAAREVERLKYGISDAIRELRGAPGAPGDWKDAQSRLDEAVVDLEQLLRGQPEVES